MEAFEIVLIIADILALLLLQFSRRLRVFLLRSAFVLLLDAAILQLVWGDGRWQIIPAYVLTAGLLVLVAGIWIFDRQWRIPRLAFPIGWAMVLGTLALKFAFPIAKFPAPTGPFAVGTVVRHLVDVSRPETLAAGVNGRRELMIQIWYPANPAARGTDARYVMSPAEVGSFNDSQFLRLNTHALLDAPISTAHARYPVLVYSPSWHGQRYQNTVLAEALASHGFVVVGIDHPYGSAVTVFPDGRVARAKPAEFWDLSSDAALKRSIQYIELQLAVRVKDVEFVADELARYNLPGSNDQFSGRLDMNRLGVFGYSFGGAVAVQTCWSDHRFRAAVDLDGALFADSARDGIQQPLLIMTDNDPPPSQSELTSSRLPHRRYEMLVDEQDQLLRRDTVNHGGYLLKIDGVDHSSFYDDLTPSLIGRVKGYGTIGQVQIMRIVGTYTLAFFEHTLNGTIQPLLDGPSRRFPRVNLEVSSPPREIR